MNAQAAAALKIVAAANGPNRIDVTVTEESGAAASDAAVVFRLPDEEPTGSFPDSTHATVAYTDITGHASATGMQWDAEPGTVAIQIVATRGALQGTTTLEHVIGAAPSRPVPPPRIASAAPIQQPGTPQPKPETPIQTERAPVIPRVSITAPPKNERLHSGGGGKKWILLAVVAAGAGAGVAMMGKGKSGSSSSSSGTSTGLTIGPPTVSVGHP
jgi:hypothetical protein